jgi:hypothetical protein
VLIAGGWFGVREKYCWLADDKPSEQGVAWKHKQTINPPLFFFFAPDDWCHLRLVRTLILRKELHLINFGGVRSTQLTRTGCVQ